MIALLRPNDPPEAFPPVDVALQEPDGLLCVGGDLSVPRLLAAYRRGIFPWYSAGQPILWWSPDPRTVLFPSEFNVSRSLAKTLRNRGYVITFDRDFEQVVRGCADRALRPEGTWITPQIRDAYAMLHQQGYAHSVEVWEADRLVGGLYGVALGRIFFGESMFSTARDASKVALHALVQALLSRHDQLIDCQVSSPHLLSLGARQIPRREFTARLEAGIDSVAPSHAWPAQTP